MSSLPRILAYRANAPFPSKANQLRRTSTPTTACSRISYAGAPPPCETNRDYLLDKVWSRRPQWVVVTGRALRGGGCRRQEHEGNIASLSNIAPASDEPPGKAFRAVHVVHFKSRACN